MQHVSEKNSVCCVGSLGPTMLVDRMPLNEKFNLSRLKRWRVGRPILNLVRRSASGRAYDTMTNRQCWLSAERSYPRPESKAATDVDNCGAKSQSCPAAKSALTIKIWRRYDYSAYIIVKSWSLPHCRVFVSWFLLGRYYEVSTFKVGYPYAVRQTRARTQSLRSSLFHLSTWIASEWDSHSWKFKAWVPLVKAWIACLIVHLYYSRNLSPGTDSEFYIE